jgi:hypothetical protein
MIKQEPKLLPNPALFGNVQGSDPNDNSKHDWKSCVSNDDQKCHKQKRPNGSLKGDHAVWCEGVSQICEC